MDTIPIAEAAAELDVSVRTLRYYDAIGLVAAQRDGSGYRRYGDGELHRARAVLQWRAMGFTLEEIRLLESGDTSHRAAALRRRAQELRSELDRLGSALDSVNGMLEQLPETTQAGIQKEGEADMDNEYAEEAYERWGNTDAYKESARRTASYGETEWNSIRAETARIERAASDLLREGVSAEDEAAMDVAEDHRLSIDRWFYPCSYEMHTALATTYVSDPRFRQHYEDVAVGLADYLSAAITANALRMTQG